MPDKETDPPGKVAGMPSDWRRPTKQRFASRAWNPAEPRLFTPKTFGWGYGINFYWVVHPVRYWRGR